MLTVVVQYRFALLGAGDLRFNFPSTPARSFKQNLPQLAQEILRRGWTAGLTLCTRWFAIPPVSPARFGYLTLHCRSMGKQLRMRQGRDNLIFWGSITCSSVQPPFILSRITWRRNSTSFNSSSIDFSMNSNFVSNIPRVRFLRRSQTGLLDGKLSEFWESVCPRDNWVGISTSALHYPRGSSHRYWAGQKV
jgi:hypothetical protein